MRSGVCSRRPIVPATLSGEAPSVCSCSDALNTGDEAETGQLVKEMARRILSKAWRVDGLWTTRLEVRTARLLNYEPMPSPWNNRRFERGWRPSEQGGSIRLGAK